MEELLPILVIEDDQQVQSVVEEALTEGGFEREEAVTLLKGNKGKYRALVTDINLGGQMNGWEVAKQARELDPKFPVLYITGAAADQWASHGVPIAFS